MGTKPYGEWIKEFLEDQGLPRIGTLAKAGLNEGHLGHLPVDPTVAFRKITPEMLSRASFNIVDEKGKTLDVYAAESFSKQPPYSMNLQRFFLSEEDVKKQASFSENTMRITKATKRHYIDEEYTAYLMALSPDGFKYSPSVEDLMEEGVFLVSFTDKSPAYADQIWVMIPKKMIHEERMAVDVLLSLREYYAVNPLDIPAIYKKIKELSKSKVKNKLWGLVASEWIKLCQLEISFDAADDIVTDTEKEEEQKSSEEETRKLEMMADIEIAG